MITNAWYAAGFSSTFARGRLYDPTIAGKPMVLWRTRRGEVVAFDGWCRHKRFPLGQGKLLDGDVLECGYHGFRYDATGACVGAPSRDAEEPPPNARLRGYPVTEKDGVVWVWPGNVHRAAWQGVPGTPEIGGARWETVGSSPLLVHAYWRLLVENLLDVTHFPGVHEKTIGAHTASHSPTRLERQLVDGMETVRATGRVLRTPTAPLLREWFGYDVADRLHTQQYLGPGLTRVRVALAPPGGLGGPAERAFIVHHLHAPIDRTRTRWMWAVSAETEFRDLTDSDRSLAAKVAAGYPAVVSEDRWALERQQEMLEYPDDGYEEVHVQTDGAVMLLRKIIEDLERREDDPDFDEIARLRTGRVAVGLDKESAKSPVKNADGP